MRRMWGLPPPHVSFFRDTLNKGSGPMGQIRLLRAFFPFPLFISIPENPVKPPFSVPVENMPDYCSVWQNTADLHLTKRPPRGFASRWISPRNLPHPGLINPARTRIWGSFYRGKIQKKPGYWDLSQGRMQKQWLFPVVWVRSAKPKDLRIIRRV